MLDWELVEYLMYNLWFWIVVGSILLLLLIVDYFRTKYRIKLADDTIDSLRDKIDSDKKKISYLIKENDRLNEQIWILEEEANRITEFTYENEIIKIDSIFKGKRALVADYDDYSSIRTRNKLRSLGLFVDVVRGGLDVINKITNGYKCDIIITNNIFRDSSSGPSVLSNLRCIKNFKTPIVIHTISHGERQSFLSMGFDEYLEKPASQEDFKKVLIKLLSKKKKTKSNTRNK